MKKTLLISLLASLIFSSCSKDMDMESYGEAATKQFTVSFIQKYGQPQQGHTWGFQSAKALTRAHDVNGNLWYQKYQRPANITQEERDKVIDEFSIQRIGATNAYNITWENYYVQQVYKGESEYVDGNGNSIGTASSKMNHLIAYNSNYVQEIWWPQRMTIQGGYEHINNFNSGNNNTVYTDDETHEQYIGTTLMVNMESDGRTEQFGYHNSVDSKNHFEYIILYIDGAYYVGFDFSASHPEGQEANKNMDVERDWIFNDWIVKISPALPIYPIESGRVMAEDLGSNEGSDFDYNDVVFDYDIYSDGVAVIELQAAGGTLPLYIESFEVHELFGVATDVMVNTFSPNEKKPVKVILTGKYMSGKDIEASVTKFGQTYNIPYFVSQPSAKIRTDKDAVWSLERIPIDVTYPKFLKFVKDQTVQFWK
jgi:hypothetical protein